MHRIDTAKHRQRKPSARIPALACTHAVVVLHILCSEPVIERRTGARAQRRCCRTHKHIVVRVISTTTERTTGSGCLVCGGGGYQAADGRRPNETAYCVPIRTCSNAHTGAPPPFTTAHHDVSRMQAVRSCMSGCRLCVLIYIV